MNETEMLGSLHRPMVLGKKQYISSSFKSSMRYKIFAGTGSIMRQIYKYFAMFKVYPKASIIGIVIEKKRTHSEFKDWKPWKLVYGKINLCEYLQKQNSKKKKRKKHV